jgi:hypothetical protein
MLNTKGKYKVELFDKNSNDYVPSSNGIGMHVEVKDPDQKMIMSKVSFFLIILTLENKLVNSIKSSIKRHTALKAVFHSQPTRLENI